MLRLSNAYLDHNILSLRTGSPIGNVGDLIINPNNLRIEGWHAAQHGVKGEFILPSNEVRDFIPKGIVVNDHDSITEADDLVRLKPIIDIEFSVLGKSIQTESKQRLGKVRDFAVDDGFYIQKLYVSSNSLRSFTNTPLIIDRNAIIEITDKKIIVSDSYSKIRAGMTATEPA